MERHLKPAHAAAAGDAQRQQELQTEMDKIAAAERDTAACTAAMAELSQASTEYINIWDTASRRGRASVDARVTQMPFVKETESVRDNLHSAYNAVHIKAVACRNACATTGDGCSPSTQVARHQQNLDDLAYNLRDACERAAVQSMKNFCTNEYITKRDKLKTSLEAPDESNGAPSRNVASLAEAMCSDRIDFTRRSDSLSKKIAQWSTEKASVDQGGPLCIVQMDECQRVCDAVGVESGGGCGIISKNEPADTAEKLKVKIDQKKTALRDLDASAVRLDMGLEDRFKQKANCDQARMDCGLTPNCPIADYFGKSDVADKKEEKKRKLLELVAKKGYASDDDLKTLGYADLMTVPSMDGEGGIAAMDKSTGEQIFISESQLKSYGVESHMSGVETRLVSTSVADAGRRVQSDLMNSLNSPPTEASSPTPVNNPPSIQTKNDDTSTIHTSAPARVDTDKKPPGNTKANDNAANQANNKGNQGNGLPLNGLTLPQQQQPQQQAAIPPQLPHCMRPEAAADPLCCQPGSSAPHCMQPVAQATEVNKGEVAAVGGAPSDVAGAGSAQEDTGAMGKFSAALERLKRMAGISSSAGKGDSSGSGISASGNGSRGKDKAKAPVGSDAPGPIAVSNGRFGTHPYQANAARPSVNSGKKGANVPRAGAVDPTQAARMADGSIDYTRFLPKGGIGRHRRMAGVKGHPEIAGKFENLFENASRAYRNNTGMLSVFLK